MAMTIQIDHLPDAVIRQITKALRNDGTLKSELTAEVRAELVANPVVPRLMTTKEVLAAMAIGPTTLHRLRTGQVDGSPDFPDPIYVGSSPRWRIEEIDAFIEASRGRK